MLFRRKLGEDQKKRKVFAVIWSTCFYLITISSKFGAIFDWILLVFYLWSSRAQISIGERSNLDWETLNLDGVRVHLSTSYSNGKDGEQKKKNDNNRK